VCVCVFACCIDTHRRRHTGDERDKREAMNQKKGYQGRIKNIL